MLNGTKKKPLFCYSCQKNFNHKTDLVRHLQSHTTEKPYVCYMCHTSYMRFSQLKAHAIAKHGEENVTYKQVIHNSEYENPPSTSVDDVNHFTGISNNMCAVPKTEGNGGNDTFSCATDNFAQNSTDIEIGGSLRNSQWNTQFQNHTEQTFGNEILVEQNFEDANLYVCPVCGEHFSRLDDLTKHKVTHQKKYPCEQCSKTFQSFAELSLHEKIHKGEGNLSCTMCDRRFTTINKLEEHQLSHKEQIFICRFCKKTFHLKLELVWHLRTHATAKPFSCRICQTSYRLVSQLKAHVIASHGKETLRLGETWTNPSHSAENFVSGCPSNLEEHMFPQNRDSQEHANLEDSFYSLDNSSRQDEIGNFKSSSSAWDFDGQHTINKFICKDCNESFKCANSLKRHSISHHNDKHIKNHRREEEGYRCLYCPKILYSGNGDVSHFKKHLADGLPFKLTSEGHYISQEARNMVYNCQQCQASFHLKKHTWDRIHEHLRNHVGDKPYSCHICNISYKLFSQLRAHTIVNHADQNLSYELDREPKEEIFPTAATVVPQERKDRSSVTLASFDTSEAEESGLLLETSESFNNRIPSILNASEAGKLYSCEFCNKSFNYSYSLKRHYMIHTGEKPYSCPVCKKRFIQLSGMKKHQQTHQTLKKKIGPRHCPNSFIPGQVLGMRDRSQGQRRELNEVPAVVEHLLFRCHFCRKPFNSETELARHLRLHTSQKPYSCQNCHVSFRLISQLRVHVIAKHGETSLHNQHSSFPYERQE